MVKEYLDNCPCGSGQGAYILRDARGIGCGYVCEKCEEKKKAKYRPEIFTNSNYWHDEPIEEDSWE